MKKQRNLSFVAAVFAALAGVFSAGCSTLSSTAQRAGIVAAGSAAGGAVAYGLSDHDPMKTGLGAVAGAVITHFAMGEDPQVRQEGFDQGYVQGQSDAIKREYFLRKEREQVKPVGSASQGGDEVYYVVPGPTTTWDGRKLEPHQVAVRVVE